MFSFVTRIYQEGLWQEREHVAQVRCEQSAYAGPGALYRVQTTVFAGGEMAAFAVAVSGLDGYRCCYKPHLSPLPDMVVGEKAFRCPVIILENETEQLILLADVDELESVPHRLPFLMDYAHDTGLYYGFGAHRESGHVYYVLEDRQEKLEADVHFGFYLLTLPKTTEVSRDFRPVLAAVWALFGEKRMLPAPRPKTLAKYLDYVYGWAFDRWARVCWQEFNWDDRRLGGVVFIVTARQKPGLGQEEVWREPKSLWNHTWFSSLRSAYGYRLYGQQTNDSALVEKAELALQFALAAPRIHGLCCSYFQAGADNRLESGHWIRSAPRRPAHHEDYVHLADNSWTCYWLLQWYRDIEPRADILAFVRSYAEALLGLQRADGGFAAWVRPEDAHASPCLEISPETGCQALFLCAFHEATKEERFLRAAEAAGDFLIQHVLPEGRWEDFETYWSCAKEWTHKQPGMRDPRSGLYHQCTLGMYWCAEAFWSLALQTGKEKYMTAGQCVLAEASLYQALYQPAAFPVPTLGGFGVMNSDDEWNDARQSLFALTYLRYWKATGKEEYLLRAQWAMAASFYMMYCPENPKVKALYERVHPHFDARDYGFHMENYNHHDGTSREGLGEFTIFDWGNGAAASSLLTFIDMYQEGLRN